MSRSQPVLPDYDGPNLTRVVPALMGAAGRRPEWIPDALRSAQQIVLLVVDGLGWNQLQERLAFVPRLAEMAGGRITSVVPSTTAAALTSLVVGAPPASHGVVGYRVVVEGPTGQEVMNVLKWRTPSGDARPFVDPRSFQVLPPFGGRPVPVVSRAEFAGTAFTDAHQRGARQVGWVQASSLAVEVKALVEAGEQFVYAYYDGLDRIAHYKGFGAYYDAELVAIDRIVGDLLDLLPTSVALGVTADHGQVQVGMNAILLDEKILTESVMVSGEARFRWLHAAPEPGAVDRLAGLTEDIYGEEAWVATYEEVEAKGWLGGQIDPAVRARLGDVALVPHRPVAYLDGTEGAEAKLECRHGSMTPDEMWIPLLGQRGKL